MDANKILPLAIFTRNSEIYSKLSYIELQLAGIESNAKRTFCNLSHDQEDGQRQDKNGSIEDLTSYLQSQFEARELLDLSALAV